MRKSRFLAVAAAAASVDVQDTHGDSSVSSFRQESRKWQPRMKINRQLWPGAFFSNDDAGTDQSIEVDNEMIAVDPL